MTSSPTPVFSSGVLRVGVRVAVLVAVSTGGAMVGVVGAVAFSSGVVDGEFVVSKAISAGLCSFCVTTTGATVMAVLAHGALAISSVARPTVVTVIDVVVLKATAGVTPRVDVRVRVG